MNDLTTLVAAALAWAQEPADFLTVTGPPSACFSIHATQDLLTFAESVETHEERNEILRRIAPAVGVSDSFKAAIMALLCGTLVETGSDPGELAPSLLRRLPAFLAAADSIAERAESEKPEALFSEQPDAFKAWTALSLMMLPTMAVLARGMEFRQIARADEELVAGIEALRERNAEADFVARVLGFVDGLELIVLHPDSGKGFRVALEAVHSNAHLFTLLQGELINGGYLPGRPVEANVLGIATGEIPQTEVVADDARWHFYNWRGMRADGSYAGGAVSTWLFVEDPPTVILELEGERIVVLGPPVLGSRSWDSNFFANIHDALRSSAKVKEMLTPEDVGRRLERIRQAQK